MNQREYLVNAQNLCLNLGGNFIIIHGRNPRLHVCYNNGPAHKWHQKIVCAIYKWPHTSPSKGGSWLCIEIDYTKKLH